MNYSSISYRLQVLTIIQEFRFPPLHQPPPWGTRVLGTFQIHLPVENATCSCANQFEDSLYRSTRIERRLIQITLPSDCLSVEHNNSLIRAWVGVECGGPQCLQQQSPEHFTKKPKVKNALANSVIKRPQIRAGSTKQALESKPPPHATKSPLGQIQDPFCVLEGKPIPRLHGHYRCFV